MVPSPSAGKLNTVLHSNGSWGNAADYDLSINLTHVEYDAVIKMIKEYIDGNKLYGAEDI